MICNERTCSGCYPVGPGIHIHPPVMPQSEIDWRRYWEAKARDRERRMPKMAKKIKTEERQWTIFPNSI